MEKDLKNRGGNYTFGKFVAELKDFYASGKLPECGSQDLRYALELQQKRLTDRGLKMEQEFAPRGHMENAVRTVRGWKDAHYNTRMEYSTYRHTKRFVENGKKLYEKSKNCIFYETVTDVNNLDVVAQDTYICPNCGFISNIGELQKGCSGCGTFFEMSDLYPVVTNFYFVEDSGGTEKEIKTSIWKVILPCILVSIIGCFIYFMLNLGVVDGIIPLIIISIFSGIIFGGTVGYIFWAVLKIGTIFINAGRSVPMLVNAAGSSQKFMALMKQVSPEFSYEYFSDKVVSLLKMIIMAEDAGDLPNYVGAPLGSSFHNIVDTTYGGATALKQFNVRNGFCYVTVDVYMETTYYNKGRVSIKNNTFRVSLCKNVMKPINFWFSIKKTQCSSCGASFDATKQRNCPNCGRRYDVGNDDWVVTSVRRQTI